VKLGSITLEDTDVDEMPPKEIRRRMEIVAAILDERERQTQEEGWTESHDDLHQNRELAQAAACYAVHPRPSMWPWATDILKVDAKSYEDRLVIAGALIVAELERVRRMSE
jgi:hypothetical protein